MRLGEPRRLRHADETVRPPVLALVVLLEPRSTVFSFANVRLSGTLPAPPVPDQEIDADISRSSFAAVARKRKLWLAGPHRLNTYGW